MLTGERSRVTGIMGQGGLTPNHTVAMTLLNQVSLLKLIRSLISFVTDFNRYFTIICSYKLELLKL